MVTEDVRYRRSILIKSDQPVMMLQNNKTLIKVICLAIMSRILLLPAPSNLYSLRDFAEVDNKFSKLDIHVLGTSKLKVPLIYYHSGI